MGNKPPVEPVNRQQRRATVKQAQKVKLPDDRKPPSVIILMFGMVAVLGIIMFGRACYFNAKDPTDLSVEEQQELATGYGAEFSAALEEWRDKEGAGVTYPEDPVEAYRYMGKRPVNPFSGFYAFKVFFKPFAEVEPDPNEDPATSVDGSSEPVEDETPPEDVLANEYGHYAYYPVTATPSAGTSGADSLENTGYYLMVYGDGTEPGADINMDGLPDRVIGLWVNAAAASGEVYLTPLKDVLEHDGVNCGKLRVTADDSELQSLVNHYFLGTGATSPPEETEAESPSASATEVSPESDPDTLPTSPVDPDLK